MKKFIAFLIMLMFVFSFATVFATETTTAKDEVIYLNSYEEYQQILQSMDGSDEAKELVAVTKQAFFEGLKMAKAGNRIGDISNAVETYVRSHGFNLVREFQGHGIGKEMHEEPGVPNIGRAGKGPRLEPGMTICIEPMVMAGREDIWELEDGWTIATQDGSLSAHYENTILITENDAKVLTIL